MNKTIKRDLPIIMLENDSLKFKKIYSKFHKYYLFARYDVRINKLILIKNLNLDYKNKIMGWIKNYFLIPKNICSTQKNLADDHEYIIIKSAF